MQKCPKTSVTKKNQISESHQTYVTKIGRKIIGTLHFVQLSNKTNWLESVYVNPQHRRKKIATRLIETVLKDYGDLPICLVVESDISSGKSLPNSTLKKFYEKFGFKSKSHSKVMIRRIL